MLEIHLTDLSGNSSKLAIENISNANFREQYIKQTQQTADDILRQTRKATENLNVNSRESVLLWKDAATKAWILRNLLIEQTRRKVSPTAAAFSSLLKGEFMTFQELVQKYTFHAHGGNKNVYPLLTLAEQGKIFENIVESSGRSNARINAISKGLGICGTIVILVTIVYVTYNIYEAVNKSLEAVKVLVSLSFGTLGAYYGTKLGSKLGSQRSPIVSFVFSIIGGLAGGFVTAFCGENLVLALSRIYCEQHSTNTNNLQSGLMLTTRRQRKDFTSSLTRIPEVD